MIDISGLPKEQVLIALFNHAKPKDVATMTLDEAKELIAANPELSFYRVRGVKLCVNLMSDTLNSWLYDVAHGSDSEPAQQAISALRGQAALVTV